MDETSNPFEDPVPSTEETKPNPDATSFVFLLSSWVGIVLAGASYAILLALIAFVFLVIMNVPSGNDDLLGAVAVFFFVVIVAALYGMVASAVTGTVAIFLVWAFNFSLNHPLSKSMAVVSAGSLAGYLPTAFVFFNVEPDLGNLAETALTVFVGPVVAMLMGAKGAHWFATKYVDSSKETARPLAIQFSIKNLFVVTAWIAGVLSFANYVGFWFLISAIIWIVMHVILLSVLSIRRKWKDKGSLLVNEKVPL